jgi:hypothetical protein
MFPPKICTILGNSAIIVKNLRPVALRPNLSRGLPLSIDVLKNNIYYYNISNIAIKKFQDFNNLYKTWNLLTCGF